METSGCTPWHCDYKCWSLLWIHHIIETPGRTLCLLGRSHLTVLAALIFVFVFIRYCPPEGEGGISSTGGGYITASPAPLPRGMPPLLPSITTANPAMEIVVQSNASSIRRKIIPCPPLAAPTLVCSRSRIPAANLFELKGEISACRASTAAAATAAAATAGCCTSTNCALDDMKCWDTAENQHSLAGTLPEIA